MKNMWMHREAQCRSLFDVIAGDMNLFRIFLNLFDSFIDFFINEKLITLLKMFNSDWWFFHRWKEHSRTWYRRMSDYSMFLRKLWFLYEFCFLQFILINTLSKKFTSDVILPNSERSLYAWWTTCWLIDVCNIFDYSMFSRQLWRFSEQRFVCFILFLFIKIL